MLLYKAHHFPARSRDFPIEHSFYAPPSRDEMLLFNVYNVASCLICHVPRCNWKSGFCLIMFPVTSCLNHQIISHNCYLGLFFLSNCRHHHLLSKNVQLRFDGSSWYVMSSRKKNRVGMFVHMNRPKRAPAPT